MIHTRSAGPSGDSPSLAFAISSGPRRYRLVVGGGVLQTRQRLRRDELARLMQGFPVCVPESFASAMS